MKKRAFTLIELLVVIAIIALLMSILMPALARVRIQALAVACTARINQWGSVFTAYCEDNNGYFHARRPADPRDWGKLWPHVYKPLYKDPKMRCCPSAENGNLHEGPYATWGGFNWEGASSSRGEAFVPSRYPILEEQRTAPHYYFGSYGQNRSIENLLSSPTDTGIWGKLEVKGGNDAPVFFDCAWVSCWGVANPDNPPAPPRYNGEYTRSDAARALIDRHGGGFTNVLFLDLSSRRVPLKQLYALKWRRGGSTCTLDYTICGCGGGTAGAATCRTNWNTDTTMPGLKKSWISDLPVF